MSGAETTPQEPLELTLFRTSAERFTSATPSQIEFLLRVETRTLGDPAQGFVVVLAVEGNDAEAGAKFFETDVRYYVGYAEGESLDAVTPESLILFAWPQAREALAVNLSRVGLPPLPLPPRPTPDLLRNLARRNVSAEDAAD